MERETFLTRVGERLDGVTAPPLPDELPRTFASGDGRLFERFEHELTQMGGEVGRVRTYEIADRLAGLSDGASTAVVTSDVGALLARVEEGLRRSACRVVEPDPATIASVDIGITGAELGVASTGSVLVRTGPGAPRAASLLPPLHVCLLPEERLVAGFEELVAELPRHASQAAQTILITGPSRTSDIERTLVRGIHGPIRVAVLVVAA